MQSPPAPAPPIPVRRLVPGLMLGALAIGAALRLYAAFSDDGIFWPDEIYQSLEPAHRLVFGYGLVPWEFIEGARNWALPGFVALLLQLSAIFGLGSPGQYLGVVHVAFVAIAVGSGFGVWKLSRAYGASELSAAVASLSLMLCGPAIYFSHRAMAENACALPVVLGLWLVLERDGTRRRRIIGASLLGLAVLLRLQCGLFCVGALGILLARRNFRVALETLGVLCVWALAFGALDAFTWHAAPGAKYGGWFHSAFKYLQFNLIEHRASQWGTAPAEFYLKVFYSSMPGIAIVVALGMVLAVRRGLGLVLLGVVFIAAHSAIAHKEIRFILPVLPLLFAAAAVGFSSLGEKFQLVPLVPLVIVSVLSAVHHRALTFGELGAYPERAGASAWDDFGPVNRLLKIASEHDDVCGMRIDAAHLAWTGGSTYLHRRAPLYMPGTPVELRHFNYAIVHPGSGAQVIAAEAGLELVRIPIPCAPDEGYTWQLP